MCTFFDKSDAFNSSCAESVCSLSNGSEVTDNPRLPSNLYANISGNKLTIFKGARWNRPCRAHLLVRRAPMLTHMFPSP